MRSRVEIVAEATDGGRTVLTRTVGEGQFAVRLTGPGRVHLVGTAAGPLGGDTADVRIRVGAGARLEVRGVAATLALPARTGGVGRVVTTIEVADGGALRHVPGPLVVCREARVETETVVTLAAEARVDLLEQVVLGRHGESGGFWSARITADRAGRPLLRTSQTSTLLAGAPLPSATGVVRALTTRFWTVPEAGAEPEAAVSGDAVRCPLGSGAVLEAALGPTLDRTLAELAALPAVPGEGAIRVPSPVPT